MKRWQLGLLLLFAFWLGAWPAQAQTDGDTLDYAEITRPSPDGCNTCVKMGGVVGCTLLACIPTPGVSSPDANLPAQAQDYSCMQVLENSQWQIRCGTSISSELWLMIPSSPIVPAQTQKWNCIRFREENDGWSVKCDLPQSDPSPVETPVLPPFDPAPHPHENPPVFTLRLSAVFEPDKTPRSSGSLTTILGDGNLRPFFRFIARPIGETITASYQAGLERTLLRAGRAELFACGDAGVATSTLGTSGIFSGCAGLKIKIKKHFSFVGIGKAESAPLNKDRLEWHADIGIEYKFSGKGVTE